MAPGGGTGGSHLPHLGNASTIEAHDTEYFVAGTPFTHLAIVWPHLSWPVCVPLHVNFLLIGVLLIAHDASLTQYSYHIHNFCVDGRGVEIPSHSP